MPLPILLRACGKQSELPEEEGDDGLGACFTPGLHGRNHEFVK